MNIEYPFKAIATDSTPGGTVTGWAMVYGPDGDVLPNPGGSVFHLPASSPVDVGWRYLQDPDDGGWKWFEPAKATMTTMGTGAGGGQQRPPGG